MSSNRITVSAVVALNSVVLTTTVQTFTHFPIKGAITSASTAGDISGSPRIYLISPQVKKTLLVTKVPRTKQLRQARPANRPNEVRGKLQALLDEYPTQKIDSRANMAGNRWICPPFWGGYTSV